MISKKVSKSKVLDHRYRPIWWDLHSRVNWLMIEHLNVRAGRIQGEGSIVFGIETKFEPFLLVHLAH